MTRVLASFAACLIFVSFALPAVPSTAAAQDNRVDAPSKEGFCGRSTNGPCDSDEGCTTGGCSGQICQSVAEESVVSTCEYRECYSPQRYNLACRCLDKKCRWAPK